MAPKYKIREIDDREKWNEFVRSCRPYTFLQSWQWGEVQKATGEGVRYLGFFDGEELVGVSLVIKVDARRGKHYLVPHGPVAKSSEKARELIPVLLDYLKANREAGYCAVRVCPLLISSDEVLKYLGKIGMRPAPMHVHAELTWILDIGKSEEELMAGMRKTTRHAVRKAEKSDIEVEVLKPSESLNRFWNLYDTTSKRHHFTPWPYDMLEAQARIFGEANQMFAVVASHKGEDVSAALLVYFGDTVYYYHGASKRLPASLPANQLVQWTAIKEARLRGARKYNFWGIAPEDEPDHPFAGITTFKKGFGGEAFDFAHAHDLPLSWRYYLLWLIETWRKRKRGF